MGKAAGWANAPKSYSLPKEAALTAYGLTLHAYIYDSSDDKAVNYDSVVFSADKAAEFAATRQGAWSSWKDVDLVWNGQPFKSQARIKIIKLWPETGNFRIRVFFNNVNKFITDPQDVAGELTAGAGPMVDFVDNWPAQLIYEEEDKGTFLEEAMDSLEWHRKAQGFISDKYKPDVFIQDTYTPNQMLEARWWHRYIDKNHRDYSEVKSKEAWQDILRMYQGLDAILGEAIKNADEKTVVAFSSDHGVLPLRRQVHLNNLFASKGWLKFNAETNEPDIDWEKTKVVYLKMAYVYVNPAGLGGNWTRAKGPAYERLCDEVIKAMSGLKDENGVRPLVRAVKWDDAPKFFELPSDRIGDIVVEAEPGYQWWEEVTRQGNLFSSPLNSGYKQAVDPKTKGMWTPFVIMGPGVKKGFFIKEPISHVDQMPTLLHLLGVNIPDYVQGRVLSEVLD